MNLLRCILLVLLLSLSLRPVLASDATGSAMHATMQAMPDADCAQAPPSAHPSDPHPGTLSHEAACAAHCALPLPAEAALATPAPIRHIWHAYAQPMQVGQPAAPPYEPPRPV